MAHILKKASFQSKIGAVFDKWWQIDVKWIASRGKNVNDVSHKSIDSHTKTSNWFEYGKGIIMMAFFPVELSRIVGQADTEEKDDFQE